MSYNQIFKQFNNDGCTAVYTESLRYVTLTKNSVSKTFSTLEVLYDRPTCMSKMSVLMG